VRSSWIMGSSSYKRVVVSMGLQIRRTRRYKRRAIANKQTKNEHNDQFANYK
jgi:hypothetical protein